MTNDIKRPPKLLAISSGGGHWIELLRLRQAFEGINTVFVTTNKDYQNMVTGCEFRTVSEVTRKQRWKLIVVALQILTIMLRERPTAIITTGAAPGYLAIRLGKLLGAKTLWVDSIANAEELSLSGQLASKHADVMLTQWRHLAIDGRIEYRGAVI